MERGEIRLKKDTKVQLVEELKEKFDKATIVILFDFKGSKVEQVNRIRRAMDKRRDVDLKVVKNTLARRAIAGSSMEALSADLVGPNAVLFAYGDPVPATKTLVDFVKEIPTIEIKAGLLAGRRIGKEEIKALAGLPGREQLLAQVLATMQAPVSGFVRLLAQVPRGLLNVLVAHKENLEKQAA